MSHQDRHPRAPAHPPMRAYTHTHSVLTPNANALEMVVKQQGGEEIKEREKKKRGGGKERGKH